MMMIMMMMMIIIIIIITMFIIYCRKGDTNRAFYVNINATK